MAKEFVGCRVSPIYFEALKDEAKRTDSSVSKLAEKMLIGSIKPIILKGKSNDWDGKNIKR